jgi:hypothetical protein
MLRVISIDISERWVLSFQLYHAKLAPVLLGKPYFMAQGWLMSVFGVSCYHVFIQRVELPRTEFSRRSLAPLVNRVTADSFDLYLDFVIMESME